MDNVLYIGHSFHQKTKSSDFLLGLLKRYFHVTTIYVDPLVSNLDIALKGLSFKHYYLLVLWQVMPSIASLRKHVSWKHGSFFPMYDHFISMGRRIDSTIWKDYEELTIISFSKALFQELLHIGYDAKYIQYFPQPQKFREWGDTKGVFFWQRVSQLNISNFIAITQHLGYNKIHWHKAPDPGHHIIPIASLLLNYQSFLKTIDIKESTWFEQKEQLFQQIEKNAFYMAPRFYEGIGMSFLDAMAMGRCVIAHDAPTMNEYIKHKENGLLYSWNDLADIDEGLNLSLSSNDIREMQQNAYSTILQGYIKWENEKEQIIDWCTQETHPNPVFFYEHLKQAKPLEVNTDVSRPASLSYMLEFIFIWKSLLLGRFKTLFYFLLIHFNSRFNRNWYINQYPDVCQMAMAPAAHYLLKGWREGRDPSLRFSTHRYLLYNPDVKTSNICPLIHWKLKGKKEKRSL